MVRILTYLWVVTQVAILLQIHYKASYVNMETLKVLEIVFFVPAILILAKRTRELRHKANFEDPLD
jgi:hypothetical protein